MNCPDCGCPFSIASATCMQCGRPQPLYVGERSLYTASALAPALVDALAEVDDDDDDVYDYDQDDDYAVEQVVEPKPLITLDRQEHDLARETDSSTRAWFDMSTFLLGEQTLESIEDLRLAREAFGREYAPESLRCQGKGEHARLARILQDVLAEAPVLIDNEGSVIASILTTREVLPVALTVARTILEEQGNEDEDDEDEDEKNDDDDDSESDQSGDGGCSSRSLKPSERRAIGQAFERAQKDNVAFERMCWSVGKAPADLERKEPSDALALAKLVVMRPNLRAFIDLVGRFERSMRVSRHPRRVRGVTEPIGIEFGGEVGRLLPSELVHLKHEPTRLDLFRRIAEKAALQREAVDVEHLDRGDFVVLLDISGSMQQGNKLTVAAAYACAACLHAAKAKRKIYGFVFESAAHRLDFPPTSPARAIEAFASVRSDGGTNFAAALEAAYKVPEAADVLLVTDGEDSVKDEVLSRLGERRLWLLGTAGAVFPNNLASAAAGVLYADKLDSDGAIEIARKAAGVNP